MELTFGNRAMSDSQSLGADCLRVYISRSIYNISTKALKIAVIMWSTTIGRGLVL